MWDYRSSFCHTVFSSPGRRIVPTTSYTTSALGSRPGCGHFGPRGTHILATVLFNPVTSRLSNSSRSARVGSSFNPYCTTIGNAQTPQNQMPGGALIRWIGPRGAQPLIKSAYENTCGDDETQDIHNDNVIQRGNDTSVITQLKDHLLNVPTPSYGI